MVILDVARLNLLLPTPGGRRLHALREISFKLQRGSCLGVVGESGCGKSLLALSLLGLQPAGSQVSGSIRLHTREVLGQSEAAWQKLRGNRIAMVFQDPGSALNPVHPIGRQVAEPLRLHQGLGRAAAWAQAADLLAQVGIPRNRLADYPHQFSGGQRQRVALGRAIVREAGVFLMDEPLSNLDAKLRVQMRAEISKLHQKLNTTMIYVTHDQTEALTMGDRIAVIKLGVLQQVGAPTELYDRPANVFVAGFIGSPSMNINTHPVVHGQAKIGEDTVDLPTEAVNKLTAEDGGKIVVGFRPEDATLATPDDPNAFSLKVQNIEDLGSDGYIYGNIITDGSAAEASTMMSDQNKLTTIRVNPRALPKVGDTVKIKIDPSKMHLFAPSTELRLN